MTKLFIHSFAALLLLGLLNCNGQQEASDPIIGMVLLPDTNMIQLDQVMAELESKWKLNIESSEVSNGTAILSIDDYNIVIAHMPMPIPGDEIEASAEYNYNWPNGVEEATKHKGHAVLSVINAGKDPLKENMLFNKIAAATMNNSEALGIYIGSRTLLLKKDFYLSNTDLMSSENLPLDNWIYFGFRQSKKKNSVYTFGLSAFNKPEMEIINSTKSLEDLSMMMYNMAHYVIASDVRLQDGETIGMSASQKLKISNSKAVFLDGYSLKIDY